MRHARITLLIVSLMLLSARPAYGQCGDQKKNDFKDCGEITAGRPKIWTLEEAHYIIEDIRSRLAQINVKPLAELDPNEVNQRTLEVLRVLFDLGIEFDQAKMIRNRIAMQNYEAQRAQAQDFSAELQQLEAELARLRADRELMEARKAALQRRLVDLPLESSDAIELNKQIQVLDIELGLLEKKIEFREARRNEIEAKGALPSAPAFEAVSPPQREAGSKLPGALLDDDGVRKTLQEDLQKILTEDPKLHYTQKLANTVEAYLQLMSRRLTLLRESLEPGYDLMFLELSASVTPSRHAKNHVARVRWEVSASDLSTTALAEVRQKLGLAKPADNAKRIEEDFGGLRASVQQLLKSVAQVEKGAHLENLLNNLKIQVEKVGASAQTTVENQRTEVEGIFDQMKSDLKAISAQMVKRPTGLAVAPFQENLDIVNQRLTSIEKLLTEWGKQGEHSDTLRAATRKYGMSWKLYPDDSVFQYLGQETCASRILDTTFFRNHVNRIHPTPTEEQIPDLAETYCRFWTETVPRIWDLIGGHAQHAENDQEKPSDRLPYIFELTPSQSALNIAKRNLTVRQNKFLGVFSLPLLGLGGKTDYQRQREQYGQLIQQRVFISGYGKGERVFGWDFAPTAGEEYASPGNYTTYAVLAYPRLAGLLKFKPAVGWYEKPEEINYWERNWHHGPPRLANLTTPLTDKLPGSLDPPQEYRVEVPTNQAYFLTAVDYAPVAAGGYVTVFIHGIQFPSETTVLIDSTPLNKRTRLSEATSDGSGAPRAGRGACELKGDFEIVSATTLALRFTCGPNYTGTPQLVLLAPSRSVRLNILPLQINGNIGHLDFTNRRFWAGIFDPFFRRRPTIAQAELVDVNDTSRRATVRLTTRDLDFPPAPACPEGQYLAQDGTWTPLSSPSYGCASEQRQLLFSDLQVGSSFQLRFTAPGCAGASCPIVLLHSEPVPYRPVLSRIETGSWKEQGNAVTLVGKELENVGSVLFGDLTGEIVGPTEAGLEVIPPELPASKAVDVRVVSRLTRNGQKLRSNALCFEYRYVPVVQALSPAEGKKSSTTAVEIAGKYFDDKSAVLVNGQPVTKEFVDHSKLRFIAPANAATGPVTVTVKNDNGTSRPLYFTYKD